MKYLALIIALSGLTLESQAAEPLTECPFCVGHKGTCGCNMMQVVCCDGTWGAGCICQ